MAAAFAFLCMLLTSLVVALLAALQLGDFFQANREFVYVIAIVAAFVAATMVVLAGAYRIAASPRMLDLAALLLVAAAFGVASAPGVVPWVASHSTNPHTVGIENTRIWFEIAVPSALGVMVQWGLIRRRWLRAAGHDDLARWPWVTTAAAALAILNPLGLSLVWSLYRPSGGDLLRDFVALIVQVGAAALVVMAGVECYIRHRVLRRRLSGPRPLSRELPDA